MLPIQLQSVKSLLFSLLAYILCSLKKVMKFICPFCSQYFQINEWIVSYNTLTYLWFRLKYFFSFTHLICRVLKEDKYYSLVICSKFKIVTFSWRRVVYLCSICIYYFRTHTHICTHKHILNTHIHISTINRRKHSVWVRN